MNRNWRKDFQLEPHPEGGMFKRIFLSENTVTRQSDSKSRAALSQIYYSLKEGEVSRFHRITSDEVWTLVDGGPLLLLLWNESSEKLTEVVLNKDRGLFSGIVPAGTWQAAKPLGEEVLCTCSVGPGFDFEDYTMIEDEAEKFKKLKSIKI